MQVAMTDDFRVQRSKSVGRIIVGIQFQVARNYAPRDKQGSADDDAATEQPRHVLGEDAD
jgi:hypothetical protein